jgi:hypothetical protein
MGELLVYAPALGRVGNLLVYVMKLSRKTAIAAVLFAAIALPTIALAAGPGNPSRPPSSPPPSPPPSSGSTHGVPGPLVGAGLPFLAVGYGAYWLVRRYRRKSDAA